MSLPAVYLQHRVQPRDRHASALFHMMKLHYPGAEDRVNLGSVSQAQVEEKRAAVLVGAAKSYFHQSEQSVNKRWAA